MATFIKRNLSMLYCKQDQLELTGGTAKTAQSTTGEDSSPSLSDAMLDIENDDDDIIDIDDVEETWAPLAMTRRQGEYLTPVRESNNNKQFNPVKEAAYIWDEATTLKNIEAKIDNIKSNNQSSATAGYTVKQSEQLRGVLCELSKAINKNTANNEYNKEKNIRAGLQALCQPGAASLVLASGPLN